ncbi:MAG: phosphohydrolase, partial [Cytophagales bacterium]|nr:phosphohydrolase [Cytophagales bacterium]
LHQLVSGQLDIDRLDYLNRDCYFTGVNEGIVSFERIINMLNVHEDEIVVEEKGIYSIENFLNARRLMYWQVYLHKTTISAELMLIQIIKRAKFCDKKSKLENISPPLAFFLQNEIKLTDFKSNPSILHQFSLLDDIDIYAAVKLWINHPDKVLSYLCNSLINRKLFSVTLQNNTFPFQEVDDIKEEVQKKLGLSKNEVSYLVLTGNMTNSAYVSGSKNINILLKNKNILDIAEASDLPNIKALRKIVRKYYLCSPKNIYL